MITLQPINPIAFEIFGLAVRWYALAYIAAFIAGYFIVKRLSGLNKKQLDDLLTYSVIGTIAGGRLGYVLFYAPMYFMQNPLEIFAIWQGGMAFHGGMLGVLLAVYLFARKNNLSALKIFDTFAIAAPLGIFFGRITNFINMEVMGRPTDGPLGVVFAGAIDQVPRYPSPLFQAALEGLLLFIIMIIMWRWTPARKYPGAMMGAFAMGYAVLRIIGEQFRAPDVHIGFLLGTSWLTMGILLSGLMFVAGGIIFIMSVKNK